MSHSRNGFLAPALACAVALLGAAGPSRAEDGGPANAGPRSTLTAEDYLTQRLAGEPAAASLLGLRSRAAFDDGAGLSLSPFERSHYEAGAGVGPGFWRLRHSLEQGWPSGRRAAGPTYFLQGRAFDVQYAVRFDKHERFEAMASWGWLSLGAGRTEQGFAGFGGFMLPLPQQGMTLRLGGELGKSSPRVMLGFDVQLGGPD